ncbi:MAG: TOMM system kinase/cyclase fusion protein [Polyangiaceae bacterium]
MLRNESESLVGSTFEGRYQIVAKLGDGGFGDVYKASQLTTGQLVALKVMNASVPRGAASIDKRVSRFLREAELCAQLHHPNIVRLLDSGQTPSGELYMVFAFAPGDNLAELLAREGALSAREACHLMAQVLDALACAHAQGVVHRDLKPSNIMIVSTGARRNAVVLDFGIGAVISGLVDEASVRLTGTGDVLGTPGYGAPEQWRGTEPSPAADVFSWGLVFIETLTGLPVYGGRSAAELHYQLLSSDPVPLPRNLERHPLADVLRLATHKDPTLRSLGAAGLLDALDRCDVRGVDPEPESGARSHEYQSSRAASLLPTEATSGSDAPLTPRPVGDERRQVTAICCRLNSVTALSSAVDVEDLDEASRAALAECAAVARRHGGSVVAALGNELLIYFGYPRAAEDDVFRAARAALAIVDAMRSESETAAKRGVGLEIGVGAHTGLVSGDTREGAITLLVGSTPQLAGQLASLAGIGAALSSAEFQRLVRSKFDTEPRALSSSARLTGDFFQLLSERDSALPTPNAARGPLVGREQEVALLLERWQRMQSAGGQCCLITGEPGIGKSRLAREVRDQLPLDGYSFLEGRCSPDTRNSVLFPVLALLARALGLESVQAASEPDAARTRLEGLIGSYGLALSDTMPLFLPLLGLPLGESYVPLDVSPQRRKELTLGAITSVLTAMADSRPLLILLEDLHWADATTLELLGRMVVQVPSVPICLLLTARPEFAPSFVTTGMLQLPLNRLSRPQIDSMVRGLLGHKQLPTAMLERVASRTDGIPLFVEEFTRMMLESGLLLEHEDHFELSEQPSGVEIPGTLRGLLTARIDRLERARETAQVAAALGREFSLDVLLAAGPNGPAAVLEDLEKLTAAGLILRKRRAKDSVGVFKHALIRDAAYDSLSKSARQRTHARIAAVLEERFPDSVKGRPDLLALHHAAAEQKREAIGYAQRAGEQSLQASAFPEAIAHVTNAVDWCEALESGDRVEAELCAQGVMVQAMMFTRGWADPGVKATAERSTTLLEQLNPFSPHRMPALWSLFAFHHTASNRAQALVVAEEMVALATQTGDPGFTAMALTIHGIALHPIGKFGAARTSLERAIELYDPALHRDHGPRIGMDSLVLAKTLLAHLRWFAGDDAEAFELVTSALAWAREINHVPTLAIGLLYGCQVYQFAGNKLVAAEMAGEILALSARYGLPAYEGYAAIVHAWSTGNEGQADAILGALAGMGCRLCLSYYSSLVAENLAERGAYQEACDRIDRCLILCTENGEHYYEPQLHRLRAAYQIKSGKADESVRASLERAIALAGNQNMARIAALAASELSSRGAN